MKKSRKRDRGDVDDKIERNRLRRFSLFDIDLKYYLPIDRPFIRRAIITAFTASMF